MNSDFTQTYYPNATYEDKTKTYYLTDNSTYVVNNDTPYEFYLLLQAQGGMSQIGGSTGEVMVQEGPTIYYTSRSVAGIAGTSIYIYINDVLETIVYGGNGNVAGQDICRRYYHRYDRRDGSGKWIGYGWNQGGTYWYKNHQISRLGQVKVIPIPFKKGTKLTFTFHTTGAKLDNSHKHGYVSIKPIAFKKA